MTRKADFDAEQWTTVTAAPALAAIAVAAADRGGTLREGLSVARTYQEARGAEHSELLTAILGAPPAVEAQGVRDAGELLDRAADTVRAASDLLRDKASGEELREYGDFVVAVTDAVARAHKEGGVLGFGGKDVSEPERAAMERIATALGERPAA